MADLAEMLQRLDERKGALAAYQNAWNGQQRAAFMTSASREALDARLTRLSVNFPRLVIRAVTDRLRVNGFTDTSSEDDTDETAWALWNRVGLTSRAELTHIDRALYGAAFVTVWGHRNNPTRPVTMHDSALTAAVDRDPADGEVETAVRRWHSRDRSHALLLERDRITRYSADKHAPTESGGWQVESVTDNPWGVVPMVPFIRYQSGDDQHGTSLVADILDLTDAVAKALQDAMVTSEYFARPRRWATGLEIEEDDDGNPVDPFGESRLLQSEDPETKFGQLASTGLDGYSDLLANLTQQIGSLSGLPAHYLGLHGDQPPTADSIRAAETQLTATAYSEQRHLTGPWSEVAGWLNAINLGTVDVPDTILPKWASPETRTPAQAADAAAKLQGMGVPLRPLLRDPMGYEPEQIERIIEQRTEERIETAGLDLNGLLP